MYYNVQDVLSLQPMIPSKRFDIFSPLTGGCSEGLDALRFFFKNPPTGECSEGLDGLRFFFKTKTMLV